MLQLALLTRQPDSYSATRLMSAAGTRDDLELNLLDPHEIYLHLQAGQPSIELSGWELDPARTVLIPRMGSLATEYSLTALEHLEHAGFRSLNPFSGLWQLRHKFLSLVSLARAGVPTPDSVMLRTPSETAPAVKQLGGYPVVLKFIRGSQGVGVVLAPDESVVTSVIEALNLVQYDVLMQRYYPEAHASDLRVLVLDGEPRWAISRSNDSGDFRSNFHRGSEAKPATLTDELAELSVRAAAVFGLKLAGVDLVETRDGPLVMEVNGSPGFQALEAAHNADVASSILDAALAV